MGNTSRTPGGDAGTKGTGSAGRTGNDAGTIRLPNLS